MTIGFVRFSGAAALAVMAFLPASGQAADPTPLLEYGSIAGVGGTLTITRLPIRLENGKLVYEDVTIELESNPTTGVLSFGSPALTQAKSPAPIVGKLKAGVYLDSTDTRYGFGLKGPFAIPGSGYSEWAISPEAALGQDCGSSSTVYTGNVADSPIGARLAAAGITSTEFNYGIIAVTKCNGNWLANGLIGVTQLGNQIKIASFTTNGVDHDIPVAFYIANLR